VLLSPDALPLSEEDRDKLQKIIAEEPLALIEYWSVDPDYDGKVFRSRGKITERILKMILIL